MRNVTFTLAALLLAVIAVDPGFAGQRGASPAPGTHGGGAVEAVAQNTTQAPSRSAGAGANAHVPDRAGGPGSFDGGSPACVSGGTFGSTAFPVLTRTFSGGQEPEPTLLGIRSDHDVAVAA